MPDNKLDPLLDDLARHYKQQPLDKQALKGALYELSKLVREKLEANKEAHEYNVELS